LKRLRNDNDCRHTQRSDRRVARSREPN
jgi:hypothetical protein